MMAAAPGGGRGAGSATSAQLPKAPALEQTPVLEIKADQVKGKSSPILYGLMTEEINYSYDGGLYAEQIRNRNFKERGGGARRGGAAAGGGVPYWSLVQTGGGSGAMALDNAQPMNEALTTSLKLTVDNVGAGGGGGTSTSAFPTKGSGAWRSGQTPSTGQRFGPRAATDLRDH